LQDEIRAYDEQCAEFENERVQLCKQTLEVQKALDQSCRDYRHWDDKRFEAHARLTKAKRAQEEAERKKIQDAKPGPWSWVNNPLLDDLVYVDFSQATSMGQAWKKLMEQENKRKEALEAELRASIQRVGTALEYKNQAWARVERTFGSPLARYDYAHWNEELAVAESAVHEIQGRIEADKALEGRPWRWTGTGFIR
jgi:hypothetical protein